MTVLERVEQVLASVRPSAICDDCMVHKVKVARRQHTNKKSRTLAERPGYSRAVGTCASCHSTNKLVVWKK